PLGGQRLPVWPVFCECQKRLQFRGSVELSNEPIFGNDWNLRILQEARFLGTLAYNKGTHCNVPCGRNLRHHASGEFPIAKMSLSKGGLFDPSGKLCITGL